MSNNTIEPCPCGAEVKEPESAGFPLPFLKRAYCAQCGLNFAGEEDEVLDTWNSLSQLVHAAMGCEGLMPDSRLAPVQNLNKAIYSWRTQRKVVRGHERLVLEYVKAHGPISLRKLEIEGPYQLSEKSRRVAAQNLVDRGELWFNHDLKLEDKER